MFDPDQHWLFPTLNKAPHPSWGSQNERRLTRPEFNDWLANDGPFAGCNLAILLGERSGNIFAVDYDVDKQSGGFTEETTARLMANGASECRAITPSSGVHDFYRGAVKQSGHKGREQVDIKAQGGYVVLYPDFSNKRDPYVHYNDFLVPDAPQSVLEWAAARVDAPVAVNGGAIDLSALQPVQGNRNESMSRFAYRLVKLGMPDDVIWPAMLGENLRYQPPMAEAELWQVLQRKRAAGIEPDEAVALRDLDISDIGYGESLSQFQARDYRPLPALCGPVQAGSLTVISGAHKAGKTLFAAYLGGHIAAGEDLENWKTAAAVPVLYIDGENQSRTQYERLMAHTFPGSDNFKIAHRDFLQENFGRFTLTEPKCQDWLVNSPARFMVMDSLTALNPPGEKSINDVDFIEAIMPLINRLTANGVGIVLLHNLNKSEQSHGSNALAWRSDRLWHLYRREGFKKNKQVLTNHHDATAGMVLRALDGDRSLQETAVDSEWQFFLGGGWRLDD